MIPITYDPKTRVYTINGVRIPKKSLDNLAGPTKPVFKSVSVSTLALKADGLDDAVIGVTEHQPGRQVLVVYDVAKVLDILRKRDGMTNSEAREFFDFNIAGAWVGDGTPVFLNRIPRGMKVQDFLDGVFDEG